MIKKTLYYNLEINIIYFLLDMLIVDVGSKIKLKII